MSRHRREASKVLPNTINFSAAEDEGFKGEGNSGLYGNVGGAAKRVGGEAHGEVVCKEKLPRPPTVAAPEAKKKQSGGGTDGS